MSMQERPFEAEDRNPPPIPSMPPPAIDERRSSGRAATVLLIGKLHDGRSDTACLVLNLSEAGLMARVSIAVHVGQRVAVELRGLPRATATVRWIDGTKLGLRFDVRQDLGPVFCMVHADGLVARAPRFAVSLAASMRLGARQFPVHVANVSPGGARLTAHVAVRAGQAGDIIIAGHDARLFGSVRWVQNGDFGFHFSTPLPLSALRDCLPG